MRSRCFVLASSFVVLSAALVLPPLAASAEPLLELSFPDADPTVARALPVGASLRLSSVPLDGSSGVRDLDLERVRVFSPDTVLRVQRADGVERLQAPGTVYLSGGIAGSPRSRAFLAVRDSGAVLGLIADGGRLWIVERDAGEAALRVAEPASDAFAAQTSSWSCASDELDAAALLDGLGAGTGIEAQATAAPSTGAATGGPDGVLYTARVAFETDTDYLAKFGGDTTAALDYIGDLVAFASSIYSLEIDTSLEVSGANLWLVPDPWTQAQGLCALYEFGRYWNDNNQGISRTIAHFLSGRSSNVGIAWLGVLCNGPFNYDSSGCSLSPTIDNYGGDYGYTGGIDGNFDINNPSPVWDIVAVAHEIGHNFSSPHTHCYADIGGNANPVDRCYNGQCGQSGCWCGAETLPCAQTGNGCGTIMSYCHLLSGGMSNISLTLGEGHPWGTAPGRVPDRMAAHVVSRANANPGCLDFFEGSSIFSDGFESGNTTAWSSAAP